jgi:hypothetical protein
MALRYRTFAALICLALAATAFAQRPAPSTRTAEARSRHATPLPAAARPTAPAPRAGILATVNGFNVTRRYFDRAVELRFARQVMEDIVRNRVVEDEARACGITASAGEVTEQVAQERLQFPSDQAYLDHVSELGYTPKGYRERIRTQVLLDKLMDQAVTVSDAEVKQYHDAHKAEFVGETELHLLAFSLPREDAVPAYRALLDGTPFGVVARRYGTQPPLASNADLGWVTRSSIPVKGLWETADGMNKGETSAPLEAEGGFYILRLMARRSPAARSLEQARAAIRARLRAGKGADEAAYIAGLVAKANIHVTWEPVASLNLDYQAMKGIRVAVNGRQVRLAQAPFKSAAGVTMVPAQRVLEAMGAKLEMGSDKASATAIRGGRKVTIGLAAGAPAAGAGPEVRGTVRAGVVFIPARQVLSALGATVVWEAAAKVLKVTIAGSG